ncbi:MAG: response regulator [Bdellovibrionota bacterium]
MKRVVCIIDDDEDVRDVVTYALEDDGFEVMPFANPEEALTELKDMDQLPGFFLLDYLMPRMDGLAFIKKIRSDYHDTLGKIPMALSSANGKINDLPTGVMELQKPMDLDVLLDLVRDHCL